MKKKIIAGLLCLSVIFINNPFFSYASQYDNRETSVTEFGAIISNYVGDIPLSASAMAIMTSIPTELFTEYDDGIFQFQKYSDALLYKLGFTPTQIYAIRNFDGSNEMRAQASGTLTLSISKNQYYYNSSEQKTYASITCTATWSSPPYITSVDDFAVGVNGSNAGFSNTSSYGYAKYTQTTDGAQVTQTFNDFQYESFGFIHHRFEPQMFMLYDDATGITHYKHLNQVQITYWGRASGNVNIIEGICAYGRGTISIEPSISVTGNTVSISFVPSLLCYELKSKIVAYSI